MARMGMNWVAAVALAVAAPASADDITISHGISSFGDLKYPPDFPHFDYVNPDAPIGGTISFRGTAASRTFDSLNFFILAGEPAQGLLRLYDRLLVRAWDEPDSYYGEVAETIEYPADRAWVIFNMRPEARFSDGHPITAEDIAYTVDAIKTEASPRFQILFEDVESTEILGEHRIKVNFAEGAQTRDLIAEVGNFPILPKHYYETVEFTDSTLDPPVGSGLYVVYDVDPGRSVTYCRNPDYWGAELPVNVGRENFECMRYEYFAENIAAFEALKSGGYLFHEEFTSAIWATGYDFPALDRGWVVQDVLDDNRPSGAQGYWFNLRKPQLQDIRVRQAVSKMFNFEWTNETLFYGLYGRTDSFWENSVMQAEGIPEGDELAFLEQYRDRLEPAVFTEPAVSPFISGNRTLDRGALRQASALLDEAGWTVGDDGMRRNEDGELLTIEIVDDSPGFDRISLPYVENLRSAGIDARWVRIDSAQMQQRQEDFDYDMAIGRFVLSLSPGQELKTLFGSQSADRPGSFNLSGLADPVIDEMIDAVLAAETREIMETRVRALDRVMRSKHIWVPQWTKGAHWLAYWDVFGRPETKPPYDRGEDYWWFDEAKYEELRAQGALR